MNYEDYFSDPEVSLWYAIEKAKPIVRSLCCPVHRRKARVQFDYNDRGLNAYITKCCCVAFADVVVKALQDAELFDHIEIVGVESID